MSPVTTTGLTKMSGLREIVVIIVTELGISRITTRARKGLLFRRRTNTTSGGKWLGGSPAVVAGV